MKVVLCGCKEYQESMPQIIGAQQLADNHGMAYHGSVFIYCPWCGKKLELKES